MSNVSAKMPQASVSVKRFVKPVFNPNLVNQTKTFNSVAVAKKQVKRARTKQFKK